MCLFEVVFQGMGRLGVAGLLVSTVGIWTFTAPRRGAKNSLRYFVGIARSKASLRLGLPYGTCVHILHSAHLLFTLTLMHP